MLKSFNYDLLESLTAPALKPLLFFEPFLKFIIYIKDKLPSPVVVLRLFY